MWVVAVWSVGVRAMGVWGIMVGVGVSMVGEVVWGEAEGVRDV